MEAHGFSWPTMLDCDKFPLDNDMCITSQSERNKQKQIKENKSKGGSVVIPSDKQGAMSLNVDENTNSKSKFRILNKTSFHSFKILFAIIRPNICI